MQSFRVLRTALIAVMGILFSLTGHTQVLEYQVSGNTSVTAPGQLQDIGNTSGRDLGQPPQLFAPINLGTVTETVYFNPINLTMEQVLSFSSPIISTATLNETHVVNGQNVSGTLTVTQSVTGGPLTCDSGPSPIVYNAGTQTYSYANQGFWPSFPDTIPISCSYTLVTGGQTLLGSFTYDLQPFGAGLMTTPFLYRQFVAQGDLLELSDANPYDNLAQDSGHTSGSPIVTADDGFEVDLVPGEYDDRQQGLNFNAPDTMAYLVPEPSSMMLFGFGLVGVACVGRATCKKSRI